MQASQLPAKPSIPFANGAGVGFIRPIPTASQIGITNGAASLTDGFVPLNFLPVGSGGIPPSGQDFNGILNLITSWTRWQAAGGTVPFDATFASAVGGYPSGALLQSTTPGNLWLNLADGNTTDPDGSSAANWIQVGSGASGPGLAALSGSRTFSTPGTFTFTVPAGVYLLYAQVWGGGGGGGGSANANASSAAGSGGGYTQGKFAVTPSQSLTVVVGAGGAAGPGGGNGTAGGTSSVGPMTATGGGGGGGANGGLQTTQAAPGTGSGGTWNFTGQTGSGGLSAGSVLAAPGGGAFCTVGTPTLGQNGSGATGYQPGGGGGGSACTGNGSSFAGGAGGAGLIHLYWGIG